MDPHSGFTVFASGPSGRVRLGPFDEARALSEARALRDLRWTSIRLFDAAAKVELDLAEMEARAGK
jgi:hypothetical protein